MLGRGGRLQVQIHFRGAVQRPDAEHADNDRAEHDFGDGPILEKKLADQDVEFGGTALLQKEAEDKTGEESEKKLRRRGGGGFGFFAALLNGCARIDHSR